MVKKKVKKSEKVLKTKTEEKVENLSSKAKDAAKELKDYLTRNKLDPAKDHSKDKKHGKKITELTTIINAERGKVKDVIKKDKEEKKVRKISGATAKYDYPLVDGKPMDSDQKKKYRIKMRQEAKSAEKAANKPKNPAMVEKKPKKKEEVPTKTKEEIKKKKVKTVKKKEED